jgi:hypothetical protein
MISSISKKKKALATYSKKAPRIHHRSTFASPTSDDRQHRKRRVTLTSPVRGDSPPSNLSAASLSLSEDVDHRDDEESQPETSLTQPSTQRRSKPSAEPATAHVLTFATSPDRAASPVSSSEHDSISDEDLMSAGPGHKKRPRRVIKPQSLSKLRKSLNLRPKKLQLLKQPTSVLSAGTIRDIEVGADGFDETQIILMAVPKPRSTRRKAPNSAGTLDILKGPHPPVDFDNSDWSILSLLQEQKETFVTVEGFRQELEAEEMLVESDRSEEAGFNSLSKSPTRPSAKEVLVYAQLSSVSAPIMRRSSHDEDSEDGYADGFLDEGEDDFEERMSDAEQEELETDSVR